jgi:RNA polymerase sigma-70 factor (ECF subfamily)
MDAHTPTHNPENIVPALIGVMGDLKPRRQGALETLMIRYAADEDDGAFAEIYRRVLPNVRRVIARRIANNAVIDDLVQRAFMKAHLARVRFDPERVRTDGTIIAWFCAIARHVTLDHIRMQMRRNQREVLAHSAEQDESLHQHYEDDTSNMEVLCLEREQRLSVIECVRQAVTRLPAGQRDVIELYRFQGLSTAETARRLQIRGGAVRVRAHRAYKSLARLLAPERALAA